MATARFNARRMGYCTACRKRASRYQEFREWYTVRQGVGVKQDDYERAWKVIQAKVREWKSTGPLYHQRCEGVPQGYVTKCEGGVIHGYPNPNG